MSALTKIFVVLLVILSLMLASGMIVFVNRQEEFQAQFKKAQNERDVALARATAVTESSAAAASERDKLAAELTSQIQATHNEIQALNKQIGDLNVQLATKDQDVKLAAASAQSANAALRVATEDIAAREKAFKELYDAKDRLNIENVGLNNHITELTSANEIYKRQNEFMSEQVTQLKSQIDDLNKILVKYNISPTGSPVATGKEINQTPAVNINGVVRDFKNINGVPFATISLGSADAVTRGMKFSVIDPTANKFLGYFTVDSVSQHEATGRLDGPGVESVKPNVSEVKTQL